MQQINLGLKNLIALFSLLFGLISCGPSIIYHHKEEVSNPWTYFSPVTFEYEITDTVLPYDLQLVIEHSNTFSYENLYINATTIFPDNNKTTYPVSLQLADTKSDWIGDCTENSCSVTIDISPGAYFKMKGKYKLILEQYSRKDGLEGIKAITLKISESQISN